MSLTTNLVSYWSLNESSGNASDSVGSATLTNNNTVTYSAGKLNNGANFVAASSQDLTNASSVPDLDSNTAFSFSFWLKSSTTTSQYVSSRCNSSAHAQWNIYTGNDSSGAIEFEISPANSALNRLTCYRVGNICDGSWHHVAIVYSGSRNTSGVTFYVDGVAGTTTSLTNTLSTNAPTGTTFALGSRTPSIGSYFNGSIDEFGIWSRALTADEVSQLFNSNRALAYPLTAPTLYGGISYWKLDENSGNAADSIGSETLTNTNVTYGTGKINNGAIFNGSSSVLKGTYLPTSFWDSDFSISCWMNAAVINGSSEYILFWAGNRDFQFNIRTDKKIVMFYNSGGAVSAVTSQTFNTSQWYYLVFVRSKTTGMAIYVNATVDGTNAGTGNGASASTGTFDIGERTGTGSWFDGTLDEIGIWNRVLTSTEVTTLYNSGNGLQYPWTVSSLNSGFLMFM